MNRRVPRIEVGGVERIEVGAQFFLEHLGGIEQLIPALRNLEAGLLERHRVEHVDTAGDRHRNAVQFAVHGGRGQQRLVELRQVENVAHRVEVGEAVAPLGEQRQPGPVDLHQTRLGPAGDLRRQPFLMPGPAGVFGLDRDVRVFLLECLDGREGRLVAAVASPPGHPDFDRVGGKSRRSQQGRHDGGSGRT